MKTRICANGFLVLLIAVLSASCAGPAGKSGPPPDSRPSSAPADDRVANLVLRYRVKAAENEEIGDLPRALRNWETIKSLVPSDVEAGEKMIRLRNEIPAAADSHFKKGEALFQSRSYPSARKEFLISLYLVPDHAGALFYLTKKMWQEETVTYEAKRGETLKNVAEKVYRDPQKDFVIAYFNGLPADTSLLPAGTLKMPVLDSPPEKKISTPDEKILPGQKKERTGGPPVDPDAGAAAQQTADTRKQLAEAHYIEGVKFFVNEEVEKAIREWESALSLDPDHPKARKDIENGRNLLKKLENIK
ncbi:MAG TPA: hypothetical protein VLS90_16745 [Thermodesulfobacteriota bacterium]|nr:hypothetical protein [Thermodesulfobacteriota bacterium]